MDFSLLLRITVILIALVQSMTAVAQTQQQFLHIQADYGRGDQHIEEAVQRIDAANVIGSEANVEYRAGSSIQLLPGFEAKSGSIFLAAVRPLSSEGGKSLRLTAYPNPFEYTTTIEYYLPASGKVNLWVTDAKGARVRQLVSEQDQPAGIHHIEWLPGEISQGVYLPVVESGQQRMTTRLIKK